MDRIRAGLLIGLRVLEAGLDRIDTARSRIEMRRFLKDHPDVTVHKLDEEQM